MSNSRPIKRLKKLKEKLSREQTVEPVEVLFIVYEKSSKRYKMEGSGFLKENFEKGEPLTDSLPSAKAK